MTSQPRSLGPLQYVLELFFIYAFGLIYWLYMLLSAIYHGQAFEKPTEQDTLRFDISRDRFWNLGKQPIPGFEHTFFQTRTGVKLHYITNRPNRKSDSGQAKGTGNLIVLIHGFPDSSMSWRYLLREPAIPINKARIVAVDMPNYGGSDSMEIPDTRVLEALTEFVIAIREEHEENAVDTNKVFNTVIVGHDWGCVVGYRLAAEAPQLADRFILSNGPHLGLAKANVDRTLASSAKIFKEFRRYPRKNLGCLKKSVYALKPLLIQTIAFGYIFTFHLPRLMVELLGSGGYACFLRTCGRLAHGRHKDEYNAQESLAATFGPGLAEVTSVTSANERYGESVRSRARSRGVAFWHQTAYYRGGLATGHWEKSLETVADLYNIESESSSSISVSPVRRRSSSSASSASFPEQYQGALRAPATIIWGEKDNAVRKSMCLDGIADYLTSKSEVILLPKTGHWTQVERESRSALAAAINLCASSDGSIPSYMTKDLSQVYDGIVSLVSK